MSDKLANILVVLIDILALSREEIKGGRVRRYAKNLIAGENKRLQDAVSKLKQFTESEDLLVGAETLTAVKRSERTLEGVSQTVQELTQSFNAFRVSTVESLEENREDQGTNQQDQVRIALQPTTSALDWYDRLNRSRVSDTGNWIREEPIFKSWLEKEFPILWVTGIPGAGKSYIASNIINYLKEQCQQHGRLHVPIH